MFRVRIKRLQAAVQAAGGSAFFLSNQEESGQPDTDYLTGFAGTTSQLLVTASGRCFLFVDYRYVERARKEAHGVVVVPVSSAAPFVKQFNALVKKMALRRVLFDSDITSVSALMHLKKIAPGLVFVGHPGIMHRVRSIKDAGEIARIKKACAITKRSFGAIRSRVVAGMTETEVAEILEKEFFAQGATGVAFPTIVAAGKNGSQPHAVPTSKKLKNGELVTIDCGAAYRGYMADFTRTFVVGGGEPPASLKKHLAAVVRAQQAGCAMVGPGVAAQEIDGVCRAVLREAGVEKHFSHGTGHGVGREVHELPVIGPHSKTVLEPGMILTVEPGVYIAGRGGIRIEDTLLVTTNGFKNLTAGD